MGDTDLVEEQILRSIWSGEAALGCKEEQSPLALLLDSILSVPIVCLTVPLGDQTPIALADSMELMPGCMLGDILSEELGVDVPINCIILVEPQIRSDAPPMSAKELGRNLGLALSSLSDPKFITSSTRRTQYQSLYSAKVTSRIMDDSVDAL